MSYRNICDELEVSIPFRYAENFQQVCIFGVIYKVSIPFRYAENTWVKIKPDEQLLFQFLLGTLKTFILLPPVPPPISVSIPFRYAENILS